MKFNKICFFTVLFHASLAIGDTTITTTIEGSTGDKVDATGTTVTSTLSAQDDLSIADDIQQVLKDGAYTGITATVSAGNVILRGSIMEDKLQDLINDISNIDRVGAVNIDGVITTKFMPSTPNLPINKPSPAAGLVAPPPVGSEESN